MKTKLSHATLAALVGLSLAACSMQTEDDIAADVDQSGSEVVTADSFSFGSWTSGGQGPAQNADFLEVTDWILDSTSSVHTNAISTAKSKGKPPTSTSTSLRAARRRPSALTTAT